MIASSRSLGINSVTGTPATVVVARAFAVTPVANRRLASRQGGGADIEGTAHPIEHRDDLGMAEVGLRHEPAALGRVVELAGEVEALEALGGQHLGPLAGLERHAVGAGEAGGDEADPGQSVPG